MLGFITRRTRPPPRAPEHRTAGASGAEADAQDQALLERVTRRDVRAFEAIYRRYHPRLHRFLGLMSARRPLVEETLNDTMLVVWNRAGSYNHQCKVSTWIFAIAYRQACKALRRQEAPVDEAWDPDELGSDNAGPERQRSEAETRAALARALDGLSAEQRSVMVLTYFHDLPYAEIAAIMECPVDTVKTRMFHGRRRLRALLSGGLEDWL